MNIINPYIHGGDEVAFDGFGNASRSFDGVDDEVIVSDSPSFPTGAQTWSCWVKPSRLTFGASGQDLMSRWGSQGSNELSAILFLANAGVGKPQFYISDNGSNVFLAASSSILTVNKWHHIVGVFTPSTSLKIYVDGVLTGTNTTNIPSAIKDTPADLKMGWRDLSFEAHFKGNICDCRIYDTDLTATEISDLYSGTNITTNLFGHWLTDADNVLDAAGTNHGTNYGSKYSYDNPSPPVEFGSASRSFDGVNDYIDCGDILDSVWNGAGKKFTFATWIKTDALDDGVIMGKLAGTANGRTWYTRIRTTGEIAFLVYQTGGTSVLFGRQTSTSGSISAGVWTHCTFVYDQTAGAGNFLKMYIDGVEATTLVDYFSSGTFTGIAVDNTTPVQISGFANGILPFGGNLADVRIYDTDLTASQISDIYSGTDVQTNLVGHWLTDNDDVEDKAGTNDGTNFGSVYSYDNPPMDLVPSRQASRDFDGVSDHVNLGNSTEFSFSDGNNDEPFSLSTWVKMDDNSTFRILSKDNGIGSDREWLLATDSGGNLNIYLIDGGQFRGREYTTPLPENEWLHISATYDGSGGENFRLGLKLYVNGVQVDNVDFGSGGYVAMDVTTNDVYIGRYATTYSDGKFADVRIYDDELTASEVLDIYNGTTDRTNLIGQWLTNSDDVLDHAGTNDGTNFGSTYSTDSPS